jgi:hypothetical protein
MRAVARMERCVSLGPIRFRAVDGSVVEDLGRLSCRSHLFIVVEAGLVPEVGADGLLLLAAAAAAAALALRAARGGQVGAPV